MKKRLGVIEIINNSTSEKRIINIWGTLFKGDNGKLISGIYFSLTPDDIPEYWYYIHKVIKYNQNFKIGYHKEFYGEFYNIGTYGLSDTTNMGSVINSLNQYVKYIHDSKYSYFTKIDKDFQYVIDANIVEKI
jgi:hypothetical protein